MAIVFALVGLVALEIYDAPTALAVPGKCKGNGCGGGTSPAPACSDGMDNDSDGLIDYPNDPGCTDANDTDETDPVAPPPPPSSGSGFEKGLRIGHAMYLTTTQLNAQMDKAKDAGATTVQIMASWRALAPSAPRVYNWTYLDNAINAAQARGLKAHVQIEKTPSWMSSTETYPPQTTTQLQQFQDFSTDLAARYQGKVARYEVWNEPNIQDFWSTGPNPAQYAALLRGGYLGIRAQDASVLVTSAGLSQNDLGFFQKTYDALQAYSDAAANHDFFDEAGVHPYASTGPFPQTALAPDQYDAAAGSWTNQWGKNSGNFQDFSWLHDEMVKRGESSKKIYIGEFGYPSGADTWMKAVPDATRADWLGRAYSIAQSTGYVSGLSWFSYVEIAPWNIVDSSLNESLTFGAFRNVTP